MTGCLRPERGSQARPRSFPVALNRAQHLPATIAAACALLRPVPCGGYENLRTASTDSQNRSRRAADVCQ
ncbi:MAG: hypothetical protein QOD35_2285 [Nocardioidaceae bacterium]|nr:hypothetical protein [Nocardioidaceae bacterium]